LILLTGATGYLGSKLLRALIVRRQEVVILKRTTSDTSRIKSLLDQCIYVDINSSSIASVFKRYDIKSIFHVATTYGRKGESALEMVETNVVFPLTLLQYGVMSGLSYFFNTSTTLPSNINPYALTKKHFEDWLKVNSKLCKTINIQPAYFYGPEDDSSKFISMIINKIQAREPSIELTSCEQKRDFFHVDDLVSAYMILFDRKESLGDYSNFEIGSGSAVALKTVVTMIAELMNYNSKQLKFGALKNRENEPLELKANLDDISRLGWRPGISLEDGLKSTIFKQ